MYLTSAPDKEPDLVAYLVREYNLDFKPVLFTSVFEVETWLLHLGISPYADWFREIVAEWERHDCFLAYDPNDPQKYVLRFIRTTTARISRELPLNNRSDPRLRKMARVEVLHESILWPDGTVTERQYPNTLSGKMSASEGDPWASLLREIREETGIQVSKSQIHKHAKLVPPGIQYFKDPNMKEGVEIDVKVTPKRPGIKTYNKLFHFWFKFVPQKYWRKQYREVREHNTLLFTWRRA